MVMAVVSSFAGPAYGAISGELMDPELVALWRTRERELMEKCNVFRRVRVQDARGQNVRSKWVEGYKEVEQQRVVRSRLVAMEIAWDIRHDTRVGTPPLKAVRVGPGVGREHGQ